MGSQERQETRETKLLCSAFRNIKSPNNQTSKSNDLSRRRYDNCPQEERVVMNNTEMSEPLRAYRDNEDPYSKYIV
jgi:transcriptional regulator of met regulon